MVAQSSLGNFTRSNRYRYLSELKTSVGLIRYYLVGVTKNGAIIGPSDIGSLVLGGE